MHSWMIPDSEEKAITSLVIIIAAAMNFG